MDTNEKKEEIETIDDYKVSIDENKKEGEVTERIENANKILKISCITNIAFTVILFILIGYHKIKDVICFWGIVSVFCLYITYLVSVITFLLISKDEVDFNLCTVDILTTLLNLILIIYIGFNSIK